jgi:hypothetical protein
MDYRGHHRIRVSIYNATTKIYNKNLGFIELLNTTDQRGSKN